MKLLNNLPSIKKQLQPNSLFWEEQIYPDLTRAKPGLIGCIINRAEAQVLRLAMIYGLLDGSDIITIKHLGSAVAFWNYCKQSAKYIFHGRELIMLLKRFSMHLKMGKKQLQKFIDCLAVMLKKNVFRMFYLNCRQMA